MQRKSRFGSRLQFSFIILEPQCRVSDARQTIGLFVGPCPIADIQRRHPDGVDGWKLVKALDLRPADQLPDRAARHGASAPDAVAIAQRRRIGALVTALNEVWTRLTPAPRRLIQKVRRQRPCDSLSSAEWARENAGLWRCCFEGTSC